MTRDEVLRLVTERVRTITGHAAIDPAKSLTDLGATSLDFVELVAGLHRELKVKVPRPELVKIRTTNDLVDALAKELA
jgi:acyl carrier protein